MNVKEFLLSVGANLENEDTKEMVESGYYEDDKLHYELIFGNDENVTNDTIIIRVEKSKSCV